MSKDHNDHSRSSRSDTAACSSSEKDPLLSAQKGNDNRQTYSSYNDEEEATTTAAPSSDSSESSSSSPNADSSRNLTRLESFYQGTEVLIENMQEVAGDFTENVVDQVCEIKDTAVEELHEAGHGDSTYLLEMTLTRNLSILPSELVQTAAAAGNNRQDDKKTGEDSDDSDIEGQALIAAQKTHDETNNQKASDEAKAPVSAYLGLASAVVSLSAIGPLLAMQHNVSASMKITWRMAGTSLLLLPVAVYDCKYHGFPLLSTPQWITFLLSTVSYVIMGLCFILSLPYTAIGNSVILANSQAIMLLIGNLFVGAPVTFLEGSGAVTAFTGAILCSKDASDSPRSGSNGNEWSTVYGDILALLAGLGGCGYLIFAKTARQNMTLIMFTFLTMLTGTILCILFQVCVLQETVSLDTDQTTGIFGFLGLSADRLPLELCIVVICNCAGTIGYVRAMHYFDSLIISVAGLMEPVVAEFLAFGFGVSMLPGLTGWLGNALVAAGTLVVVWPSTNKVKTMPSH